MAFTLVIAFAVPLMLILLESVVALVRPSVARSVHRVVLGLLGAVLGLNVARQFDIEALVLAVALAVAFAVLVLWLQRYAAARSVLHYLGIAPLAFAALFIFSSEAGSLVFTEDAQVVELEAGTGGPVAVLVLDELPLASLLDRNGHVNEQRFPELRPPGRPVDVVPQCDLGQPVHPGIGAVGSSPGSTPSRAGSPPRLTGPSTSSPSWAASTGWMPSKASPTSARTSSASPTSST